MPFPSNLSTAQVGMGVGPVQALHHHQQQQAMMMNGVNPAMHMMNMGLGLESISFTPDQMQQLQVRHVKQM
jgi:hypothetical protein